MRMPGIATSSWDAVLGKKVFGRFAGSWVAWAEKGRSGLDASTWTGRWHLLIPTPEEWEAADKSGGWRGQRGFCWGRTDRGAPKHIGTRPLGPRSASWLLQLLSPKPFVVGMKTGLPGCSPVYDGAISMGMWSKESRAWLLSLLKAVLKQQSGALLRCRSSMHLH